MSNESTPQHPGQFSREGGRFGNGVFSMRPEEYKGDPSLVEGHPSNPLTFAGQALENRPPLTPENHAPDESESLSLDALNAAKKADFMGRHGEKGLYVLRTGGQVEVMWPSEATTMSGRTRNGEAVTVEISDGNVVVDDRQGGRKALGMDILESSQAELAELFERQRTGDVSNDTEELAVASAQRVIEPQDKLEGKTPENSDVTTVEVSQIEASIAELTEGLSEDQLTQLWRVSSQESHLRKYAISSDYKWHEREYGRLSDLKKGLDDKSRKVLSQYCRLMNNLREARD